MVCEETGDIIEYFNQELEDLQEKIANEFGYTVVRHVHQLFVKPLKK
jgi:Fur family ferric uptake transcriptional regulator